MRSTPLLQGDTGPGRLAIALLGVVLAMGARALMQPWVGDAVPFALAFPAVVLVHAWAGFPAALLAALGCAAWGLWSALPPHATPIHALLFLSAALVFALLLKRVLDPVGDPARASEPRSSLMWWLRVGIALSLVLPAALFSSIALYAYKAAVADMRLRVNLSARIAAEHASRVIETNTLLAQRVQRDIDGLSDEQIRQREAVFHADLRSLLQRAPQIQAISVWGAQGDWLFSSRTYPAPPGMDARARDYFTLCRDGTADWVVSQPGVSRVSGEDFFATAYCRRAPDGRFLGVVAVSLRPAYFQTFYESLAENEPGLALSLVRTDGVMLVSQAGDGVHPVPAPSSDAVAQMQAGAPLVWGDMLDPATGDVVTVMMRRLDPFPLYLRAAMRRSVALGLWQRQTSVLAGVVFPAALAMAWVTSLALRRARREAEAVRLLRAESEQRSRAERALQQSQKLEALGQLTGGVAHDFNNLLMVVSNNAHLLRRQHPQLHDAKALAGIQRAVQSGAKLTRQLLAFSRRQALLPEVVRLQERVPELADFLRTSLGSAVALELDVAHDAAAVRVDVAEFELALLNLAINARDAMPRGGKLCIRVRNTQPEAPSPAPGAKEVLIAVADSGCGIAAELLPRVFEPFFTTKAPGAGTGLGLSQVYGFCAQAGGHAEVRSTPGQGTEVLLVLPAHDGVPDGRVNEARAERPGPPLRVLLVEDNFDIAQSAGALIRSFGHAVHHRADADAALAWLGMNARECDVMLTDVMMPGSLNGLALAARVRRQWPAIGVVVMTGYAAEWQQARDEGLTVLAKPVEAAVLQAALRDAARPDGR